MKLYFKLPLSLLTLILGQALAQTKNSSAMSYEKLKEIINKNNVTTIEQLLPLLPEEYRKDYTFVYDSQATQSSEVSPEFPRTIVFGQDAKFVIAFTGKEKEKDTLEVMEWDEKAANFKLREINFDGKKNPLVPEPEVNPSKCLSCHGNPPKPNWDGYNIWPGVYGSISRGKCDAIHQGSPEEKLYTSFLNTNRKKGRYQYLPKEIGQHEQKCILDFYDKLLKPFMNGARGNPNEHLTSLYAKLNYQMMRKQIDSHPHADKFKYVIKAMQSNCFIDYTPYDDELGKYWLSSFNSEKQYASLDDFFPEAMKKNHLSFKELTNKIIQQDLASYIRAANENSRKNYPAISGSHAAFYLWAPNNLVNRGNGWEDYLGPEYRQQNATNTALINYLWEKMGFSWKHVSTGFNRGEYDFSTGDTPLHILLLFPPDNKLNDLSCDQLKEESLKALSSVPEYCEPQTDKKIQNLKSDVEDITNKIPYQDTFQKLQICSGCHQNVFSDAESFKKNQEQYPDLLKHMQDRLRGFTKEGQPVNQMPPNSQPFTEEEQKRIMKDLKDLVEEDKKSSR